MATVPVTVTVTGDPSNPTLALDPSSVQLNSGDVLAWSFQNVPSDCVPGILFDSNAGFGPLQDMALGGNLILGRGNNGQTGTYSYIPQLLDASGVRAASPQTGSVQNLSSTQDTSPMTVIPCQIQEGTNAVTIGDIDTLNLFTGDTAFWVVTGLNSNFFVNFRFLLSSGDLATGPFESLVFNNGLDGNGSAMVAAIGLNFKLPTDASNPLTYHVEVRDTSGVVVAHQDPQIDNLGAPPQG